MNGRERGLYISTILLLLQGHTLYAIHDMGSSVGACKTGL